MTKKTQKKTIQNSLNYMNSFPMAVSRAAANATLPSARLKPAFLLYQAESLTGVCGSKFQDHIVGCVLNNLTAARRLAITRSTLGS